MNTPAAAPDEPTLRSAEDRDLLDAARRAREHAHAPYSAFAVGAAVRTRSGAVFVGANIENSSYGLSMCAERVALFAARLAGSDAVTDIAVIGDVDEPLSPCGACRQVMTELAPDARVLMATTRSAVVEASDVRSLLPRAFGARALHRHLG